MRSSPQAEGSGFRGGQQTARLGSGQGEEEVAHRYVGDGLLAPLPVRAGPGQAQGTLPVANRCGLDLKDLEGREALGAPLRGRLRGSLGEARAGLDELGSHPRIDRGGRRRRGRIGRRRLGFA